MLSEFYTATSPIREMDGKPDEIVGFINKTLLSIAEVASVGKFNFISPLEAPFRPGEKEHEEAGRMASAQVMLDQLTTQLCEACRLALNNGTRPSSALTKDARNPAVASSFPEALDRLGMVYDAYLKEREHFYSGIKDEEHLTRSVSGKNPLAISWNFDGGLMEQALRYTIAKEAFGRSKWEVVMHATVRPYDIQGHGE